MLEYYLRRLEEESYTAERSVTAAASQMTKDRDASQAKQWIRCEKPKLRGLALRYKATASRRER